MSYEQGDPSSSLSFSHDTQWVTLGGKSRSLNLTHLTVVIRVTQGESQIKYPNVLLSYLSIDLF